MNNLDRGVRALETLLTTRGLPLLDTDQRTALAAWPGWGVFAPAFDSDAAVRENVAGLVDKIGTGTMADVIKATATSFYTPKWLVKRLFSLLSAHGTTSGRVLEPGCGNGRFMMVEPGYEWTGVEADPITAMIASSLNPGADIRTGKLEDVHLSPESFDAVIGNVPFSAGAIHDRFGHYAPTLHDYFLRRSIAALKPGGIAVLIISTGFMERPAELDDARIVGAVRLPSGTFVGTAVPADIIVVRKDDGQDAPSVNTEPMGYGMRTLTRSPYFAQNPQMVAGEHRESSHYAVDFTVHSDSPGEDSVAAIELLAEVVRALPAPLDVAGPVFDEIIDDQVDGSFRIAPDGSITRRDMGQDVPVRPSAELTSLIELRDLAIELIRADASAAREARDFDAVTVNADLRARVLSAYSAYAEAFGPLNRGTMHEGPEDPETGEPKLSWRRPTMGGFAKDPEYMTVMALENYDQDHGTASPAAILTRAVNRPARIVDHVANAAEALSVSRGEVGKLDLDRVASLTGRDLHTVTTELADLGLIYPDPVTGGRWTLADDYLSGDVRSKLSLARTAAKVDPSYQANVTALEQAMPDQAGPESIIVRLGAPWVPAKYIRDFTSQVLGLVNGLSITAMPAIGAWEVSEKRYSRGDDNHKWAAYSTSRATARDILNAALNAGTITIWDDKHVDGKVRKVRNVPETMAAQAKMDLMNEEMSTWVWEDAERADDLVRIFNETFRSHAPRSHSGDHLTFPDLADDAHELWPWQRSVIDRVVSTPAVMCAHPVGSGKTLSILGSVMSLRRFGIANKPMVTVPGHLLEQISREARQAFPTGKFLIATKEDLSPSRRRLFAARCATGDWDAVILTHESFTSIPAPAWAQEQYIVGEQDSLLSRVGDVHAKKVSAAIRSMERKVAKARENISDDSALTFDQLGIDYIAVDEAAQFKRLPISSRADGFSLGASKRALDLLIKIRMISSDRPHVALFTGTPWSNSLAETFVWQTYLQPERLRQMNVDTFDAWAAMFVQYETSVEVSPEGSSFRMNTRPSRVSNVRTLMGMFSEVCDLLDSSSLPIKRPDAQYHTVKVEPGPAQSDFVAHLAERADLLRAGGVSPKDDNMLLICGQGRTVALDPRLVDLDEDSPKIEEVARRIADVHERTSDIDYGRGRPGAFQLALCDLGTPGKGGSRTYGRLKKRLVELGMKPASIRFVHEAPSDKARAALFAACRDGSVSVLIGSTSKVGIGTNIQDRLVALHHVDAPWRPSDVVQREGRGLRPGNLNDAVEIYRYVTEGTFDAYTWQTLQRKAAFIHSLVNGHVDVDTMDDIGEQVLSFGEVKAAAAGNPLLLEQATLQSRARTLRMLRASHRKHVTSMHTRASTLKMEASAARNLARAITEATSGTNLREYETSDEIAQWLITSALSGAHLGQFGLNVSRGEGDMLWRIGRTEQRVHVEYVTRSIKREVLLDFTISVDVLTDDEALSRVKAGMTKRVRKLAGEPDRLLVAAQEKEDERASLEVAANGMTFEDDGELARVLNDLARIDAEIAGHADPERELTAA